MKVTILTITYNREHLLPRTVDSVLSQTFTDFEYLIINNGSTDGTQALIDQYCKRDNRIRIFSFIQNRTNIEFYHAKYQIATENQMIPYCMIIDDDDYMESNTVETLYNLITNYDADVASVGSMYVFPDGTKKDKFVFDGIYLYNRNEAMIEILKREKFNVSLGGKLFRKEILKDIIPPQVEQIRDIHVGYRRMNKVQKMVVIGKPLYYFYRHGSNVSGLEAVSQITPEKIQQHLEANAIRTEWLTEHMPEIKDFAFYCELSFMISLYERIYRLDVQSCFSIAQQMKDTLARNSIFLSKCGFYSEKEKEILKSMINLTDTGRKL